MLTWVQLPILMENILGMETHEVKIGKQSVVNVVMKPSSIMVDEVVVTAMGVKAEKKKLNYAVQSLDSEEIMGGANTNFVNTLQGKISGLSVSTSGVVFHQLMPDSLMNHY